MLDRFLRHLEQISLIPAGARVLVGYSGGADSTCLLHLLKEAGIEVVAAHLHHGQRPEADQELRLCEAFCQELGVEFVSGRADVPRMAQDLKMGLEEAGRHARYGFFTQASGRLECSLIATAHTRSDLVETVLLNLARGSGMSGLAGIPQQRGNIVRPLLAFSRTQTRDYCDEHGFWYHDDPANTDMTFARARIRHRVLPDLHAINESADAGIARLAEIVDEEDRFLNGMAAAALEQSELPLNGELKFLTLDIEASFDRLKLAHLPPVLFKRSIRLATEALGASLDFPQTLAIQRGVATDEKGSVTAEGGTVVVEWDADSIGVRTLLPTTPFRYTITLPGETISDEFGWQFVAFEDPASNEKPVRAAMAVEFDREKVKGGLFFRTMTAGDTMQPFGFDGHRKLSDLLSEAKLSSAARSRLPIVCDLVGPLWAPGVCLDARAAKNDGSSRVVFLRFGPLNG